MKLRACALGLLAGVLSGIAIAGGLGWASTGWVGALLALAGLLIFGLSLAEEARSGRANALVSDGA